MTHVFQLVAFTAALGLSLAVFTPHESAGCNNTHIATFGGRCVIHMGGLFAFPGSPSIGMQQEVAQTALDHVNSLDGILDGYHLSMRWNWTGSADPEEGLRILYNLAYSRAPVPIIWGPLLPQEAIIVNKVAARFNIVQITLASGPALTDRSLYPYTVRAYPSDRSRSLGVAAFIREMGWRRIAFIFEENAAFQTHTKDLRQILEADEVEIVASEGVKNIDLFQVHLQNLKRQDVRIIYTGFSNIPAMLKLFCQAYIAGLTGAKYVLIPPFWANFEWWLLGTPSEIEPCTEEEIISAVDLSLHFNVKHRSQGLPELDFSGVKPLPEHYDYYNRIFPFSNNVVPVTHDGIMSVALALNSSIADLQRLQPPRRLEDFSYTDTEMARVILNHAENMEFSGLSGRVRIEDGQRIAQRVYIDQAQGTSLKNVMQYKIQEAVLIDSETTRIKWPGGRIPVDGVTRRSLVLEVSSTARAILFSLASLGAVLALAFLFLNVRYKHRRAIKMSSPSLGNLTVVGCLLLYASVFATGWDKKDLSDTAIIVKCHLERMLISLGLSFAFGSIFMRTYRIHAIFSRAVKKFQRIDLPDWKLICGVLTAVFVDCVIFAAWITLDTATVTKRDLEPQLDTTEPEKEIYDVPIIRYCSSEHAQYFTIALYGLKGVLLTFGLFLAWETRNIAVTRLNDSKYIAASVYMVALTIALVVPTMTVLGDDVNMTFLVPGVAIVIVNTAVLCLNFIPKVYLLVSVEEKNICLSMMNSTGYGESSASKEKDNINELEELREKLKQKEDELFLLTKDTPSSTFHGTHVN
ncbi:gamma-aminobutyric acid type B receptor subunit 2-like isoform X1 [Patiria miniata]|uniref:G-protein coupled receptors family 3 profile domain-containing protein n=1 Tax=Patiria miniata TaxID=46514 RepID=A0A914AXN2_PATMI|nr:gamma-aminobutyric acid type B receptor subunit 2-like isoform X1 [Patiria miniata]